MFRRLIKKAPSILAIALFLGILVPRSIMAVAATLGYEMHVVSFILGPASYAFGDHLVPGINYFSQYSVGLPYLFSFFLGKTADAALLNYVRLMVLSMFLFYSGLFYCLKGMLASWRWALVTTLIILILQFHTDRIFFDPSSYVLRYPLFVLTVWATSFWIRTDQSFGSVALLGAVIGGSIFLNTETGLYLLLAVVGVGVLCGHLKSGRIVWPFLPGLWGLGFFMVFCYIAFGQTVFSRQFLAGLVQPFVIYGGGFGGVPIDWQFSWHILYNIIAPGSALVTIVFCAKKFWEGDFSPSLRSKYSSLLMFCFVGLLMSAKYINMSLVALWHVNAIGFMVVLAWWGKQIQDLLESEKLNRPATSFQRHYLFTGLLGVLALSLLAFANDSRNPNYYGLKAWLKYPALLNPLAWRADTKCHDLSCSAPRILAEDVDLINRWVPPRQRVAILGWHDWAYLISASRPSWFHFLPSPAIFTRQQLSAANRPPGIIFLPKSVKLNSIHPEIARLWSDDLKNFEPKEATPNLVVWKRR
jgi:hypothetical protein